FCELCNLPGGRFVALWPDRTLVDHADRSIEQYRRFSRALEFQLEPNLSRRWRVCCKRAESELCQEQDGHQTLHKNSTWPNMSGVFIQVEAKNQHPVFGGSSSPGPACFFA